MHDPDKTLEGTDLHRYRRALSSFADDLHDVVAFTLRTVGGKPVNWLMTKGSIKCNNTHLALKVVSNELEGVVQRLNGGGLDLCGSLLLTSALNDGSKDLV
jgi:hypothetical protein